MGGRGKWRLMGNRRLVRYEHTVRAQRRAMVADARELEWRRELEEVERLERKAREAAAAKGGKE